MKLPHWAKYSWEQLDEYSYNLHKIIALLSPHCEKECREQWIVFKFLRKKQALEKKWSML